MRSAVRYFARCSRLVSSSRTLATSSAPDNSMLEKATVRPSLLKPYVGDILQNEDYFEMRRLVRIEDMFDARVHYGHKIGTLNEKMKWSLYGERLGICIFDLDITREYLIKALNFISHVAYRGGIILFVSSDRSNMQMIERMASSVGEYSHVRKWQEGTLTNSRQLFGAPVRLPDTIVFLSTLTSVLETHPAVIEAAKMAIPSVGVVDSNSDPSYITYAIPGNDDSTPSVQYFMNLFVRAVETGKRARAASQRAS
uniref:Small ribosomal subunit protein uS2m n=1 Tax=Parascaris univalens TaxID=6257 RepID=A0A915BEK9_PARUN